MGGVSVGGIVGFAILTIGVVLSIVGIATDKWISMSIDHGPVYQYFGLFRLCTDIKISVCLPYTDIARNPFTPSSRYKAAIAFLLTGLIMSGLSMIFNFVILLLSLRQGPSRSNRMSLAILSLLLSLFGAILMLGGTVTFVVHVLLEIGNVDPDIYVGFHYSFVLTIIGFVLVLIGGITTYAMIRSQLQPGQVMSPGQTNTTVVQNQYNMQTAAFSGQPQQQYPSFNAAPLPSAAAVQQPYQQPYHPYAAPYGKPAERGQSDGW